MRLRLFFLPLVFVAFQCSTDHSNQSENISEPKSDSVVQVQSTKNSKYLKITIVEYDQYKSLFETIIQTDSLKKVEEDYKTGKIEKTLLAIKTPGILNNLEPYLDRNFSRSNDFYEPRLSSNRFIHIKILQRDSKEIRVSFRNSKSLELDTLLNIVNAYLPQKDKIIAHGSYVKDTYVSPNQIATWNELINAGTYESNEFDVDDIDKSKFARIDSTVFGKHLNKSLYIKSAYILSVKEKIGSFYPCVILQEDFEADEIYNSVALVMLDSALEKEVNQITISTAWEEYAMNFVSIGRVDSNRVSVRKWETYDCEVGESDYERLQLNETYQLTDLGEIELVKVDTLDQQLCK